MYGHASLSAIISGTWPAIVTVTAASSSLRLGGLTVSTYIALGHRGHRVAVDSGGKLGASPVQVWVRARASRPL